MSAGNALINAELHKLEADALITLYVLDASRIGGDVRRFYNHSRELIAPIQWQGATYLPFPIEVKGYEFRGSGSPPRPSLFLGNVGGAISALVIAFDDLIGARLTRKRTFRKFLDGMTGANPTAGYPDDVFVIERKVSEQRPLVEFELTTGIDVDDVLLPKRAIMANLCAWQYRGAECSFAGDRCVADINDARLGPPNNPRGVWLPGNTYHFGDEVWTLAQRGTRRYWYCGDDVGGVGIVGMAYTPGLVTNWIADECSRTVTGCRKRFAGNFLGLPYGGFPTASRQAG